MSSRLLLASLFSVASLAACGGGGSDAAAPAPASSTAPAPSPAPAPAPAPGTQSGLVSAAFVAGPNPTKMFFGVGSQSNGHFSTFTQQTNGAVTTIDGVSLGAPSTVRDISGDATYAMGRWAAGTVSGLTSPVTLTESSNAAYHYVIFNTPASTPATGTLACDAGTFTTPTWTGGTSVSSADNLGHITGTAQLSFSSSGAAVQLVLNLANNVNTGTNNFSTTIAPGVASAFAGHSIGAGQPGAFVALSASGTAYDVVGGYMANTSNSAQYTGTFRFHCK